MYLHKELFICESEYVGDSRGFIVQAEARQQQQEGRRSGASLVSSALTKLARRLAHKLYKAHHQALTYTLAAEFTLRGEDREGLSLSLCITIRMYQIKGLVHPNMKTLDRQTCTYSLPNVKHNKASPSNFSKHIATVWKTTQMEF